MQEMTIKGLRRKRNARRAVLVAVVLWLCIFLLVALSATPQVKPWIVLPLLGASFVAAFWGGHVFFEIPCPNCQHAFAERGFFGLKAWSEVLFRTQCQHCRASWERLEP
ncbi:MAG TPA: hypothetical protein VH814_22235 [Steroidobacteraceae bacterium]|jgi:fatty acid desaturase